MHLSLCSFGSSATWNSTAKIVQASRGCCRPRWVAQRSPGAWAHVGRFLRTWHRVSSTMAMVPWYAMVIWVANGLPPIFFWMVDWSSFSSIRCPFWEVSTCINHFQTHPFQDKQKIKLTTLQFSLSSPSGGPAEGLNFVKFQCSCFRTALRAPKNRQALLNVNRTSSQIDRDVISIFPTKAFAAACVLEFPWQRAMMPWLYIGAGEAGFWMTGSHLTFAEALMATRQILQTDWKEFLFFLQPTQGWWAQGWFLPQSSSNDGCTYGSMLSRDLPGPIFGDRQICLQNCNSTVL